MRCGALTTPLRLQVDLDHKDADEQTFTEYCPHTFQALVTKQHPDPGESGACQRHWGSRW